MEHSGGGAQVLPLGGNDAEERLEKLGASSSQSSLACTLFILEMDANQVLSRLGLPPEHDHASPRGLILLVVGGHFLMWTSCGGDYGLYVLPDCLALGGSLCEK